MTPRRAVVVLLLALVLFGVVGQIVRAATAAPSPTSTAAPQPATTSTPGRSSTMSSPAAG